MQQCPETIRFVRASLRDLIAQRARGNVLLMSVVPDQGHTHTHTTFTHSPLSTHSTDTFLLYCKSCTQPKQARAQIL